MFYTDFEESISFDSDDPDFYSTSGIYGDKENYFEYNSGGKFYIFYNIDYIYVICK